MVFEAVKNSGWRYEEGDVEVKFAFRECFGVLKLEMSLRREAEDDEENGRFWKGDDHDVCDGFFGSIFRSNSDLCEDLSETEKMVNFLMLSFQFECGDGRGFY